MIGAIASATRPRSSASTPAASRSRRQHRTLALGERSPCPSAQGTIRMSLNRIAASKPKRRIGCNVTSAASAGLVQSAMKSPALARTSRYSGR